MIKVAVGISGGVDSAVAAILCKQKGYDVIGVTMKIWDGSISAQTDGTRHACFGPEEEQDLEDAEQVCRKIGIPLHVVDCSEYFSRKILSYFRNTYLQGNTPNPCVFCNQELKFGLLTDLLLQQGIQFDYFVTGHYAQIESSADGDVHLVQAADINKDQSYFLHRLTKEQIRKTIFPLGSLTKSEVREIAEESGLHVWNKEESQDFYSGDYRSLISSGCSCQKNGYIVDVNGNRLGEHNGIWNFTVGQRKGLGITGKNPLYVIELNAENNSVVVGEKEHLFKSAVEVDNFNQLEELPEYACCKVRSSSEFHNCKITGGGSSPVKILFEKPVMGVCPGQFAVIYNGRTVVGGGVIKKESGLQQ